MDFINKFWEAFKRDKITTICGLVFAIAYYISSEPNSVAFLGPDIANFMIGLADFLKGLSVAVGLLFAAQTRPDSLVKKNQLEVAPDSINQTENKTEKD
jgi:hypothetical protein